MIPKREMKEFILEEIDTLSGRNLLTIYCSLLRQRGISYQMVRTSWRKFKDRQIKLFKTE